MAVFILTVTTEPKDECEAGAGREPTQDELVRAVESELTYAFRDYETPWRVIRVEA